MTASPDTPVDPASALEALRDEPLFRLQIRVARRADELSRQMVWSRDADLVSWGRAEEEVLAAETVKDDSPIPSAA